LEPELLEQLLEDMAADSRRAGEIIRGVRALVRKEKNASSVLNLNTIVADTLRLISPDISLRESVVATELDPDLPEVEASPVQMQQVLLNLIRNALDAVEALTPNKRRIVITTRSSAKRDSAEVSVRDFGSGLPVDPPAKVFDHFFSTKPHGMGMGLTIVRSIVESHNGMISAENAEGGGARFFFRLPATSQQAKTWTA
jgi:signal transduction histidine kinase